ncbi:MAG: ATPase [Acidobacteria bacterium]|nr:ATPase [Acidobacteriota bacterium]
MARLFLGVDGGQSSTTALIGDETGRVVGFGRGGPCNHVRASEGRAKFLNAIGGCVRSALDQAGVGEARFASACLGFSGGPADKEALVRELLSAGRLNVTNDAVVALAGACAGEPGLIVIAGTGSISLGRNAAGETARAGGWGYVFGDEGGAFDIVRQALRAALRFEEGWGEPTALRALLLEATGAADANELMHRFYMADWPRSRVATFAPLVDQAAADGDEAASDVIGRAAAELGLLGRAVRRRLFGDQERVRVSYIGGVFRSGRLLTAFARHFAGDRFDAPEYGPAAGALIEAYRAEGLRPVLENLPEFEK